MALALILAPPTPQRRLGRPQRPAVKGVPAWVCASAALVASVLLLPPTTVIAAAAVGTTLVTRRRRNVRRRRAAAERRALAAALEVLVGELRIGAHPVRAFEAAAGEVSAGVGTALAAVAARARLGADVVSGLRAAAARSELRAEWERVAVAWQLAGDHGMAISVMMRAAQTDIIERQRFWGRVQANMAGARATAVILAALPVVGVALGELIGAAPLAFLAGGGPGGWLLVVGTALLCAGLCWADRITDRLPL